MSFLTKLLEILKGMDWKPLLRQAYYSAVKPELEKLVADSANKWDDLALKAVEYLVELELGPDASAAKAALVASAMPQPEPAPV